MLDKNSHKMSISLSFRLVLLAALVRTSHAEPLLQYEVPKPSSMTSSASGPAVAEHFYSTYTSTVFTTVFYVPTRSESSSSNISSAQSSYETSSTVPTTDPAATFSTDLLAAVWSSLIPQSTTTSQSTISSSKSTTSERASTSGSTTTTVVVSAGVETGSLPMLSATQPASSDPHHTRAFASKIATAPKSDPVPTSRRGGITIVPIMGDSGKDHRGRKSDGDAMAM